MLKNVLYGLIPAQVIAFFHVYFSNLNLHEFLTAAGRAGYLIIPGSDILPSLKAMGPAFCGGLFFTLTVGAGLAILSYGFCWIWIYWFKRNRVFLVFITTFWLTLLLLINMKGFSLFPSLYLLIIPLTVILTTLRSIPGHAQDRKAFSIFIHLAPVLILAVLWIAGYNKQMFLDIRDNLLLSNKIGQEITSFYYQYTLYPAEAFKTLDQKLLKGCYILPQNDRILRGRLEEKLLDYDYLVFNSPEEVQLKLEIREGSLYLIHNRDIINRVPVKDFFGDPGAALKIFSRQTDTNGLFRYLTFLSLLGGFPLLLYLLFYSILERPVRRFVQPEWSGWIASFLCLVLGLVVLSLLPAERSRHLSPDDIGKALQASEWRSRTEALKFIEEENLEIGRSRSYKALLTSPHIAERYWLARALGRSRKYSTVKDIITLVNDSQPNVACMALNSLGKRRDKRSIPIILKKIKSAKHWYVEWYGYRALRALGWKQKRST